MTNTPNKRPMFRDLGLTYEEAAHGVQSAIRYRLIKSRGHYPSSESVMSDDFASPKHLRVGIDLRASDAAGLARLLIDKGLFTEEEYVEYMRLAANEELAREQDALGAAFR